MWGASVRGPARLSGELSLAPCLRAVASCRVMPITYLFVTSDQPELAWVLTVFEPEAAG